MEIALRDSPGQAEWMPMADGGPRFRMWECRSGPHDAALFDAGDLTGWTLSGTCTNAVVQSVIFRSPGYAFQTGPSAGTCVLSQDIPTTAGLQYLFAWFFRTTEVAPPANQLVALFNGNVLFDESDLTMGVFAGWSDLVTATSAVSTISLELTNTGGQFYIDDVALFEYPVSVPVPEPSALALIAAGVVALLLTRRRHRVT